MEHRWLKKSRKTKLLHQSTASENEVLSDSSQMKKYCNVYIPGSIPVWTTFAAVSIAPRFCPTQNVSIPTRMSHALFLSLHCSEAQAHVPMFPSPLAPHTHKNNFSTRRRQGTSSNPIQSTQPINHRKVSQIWSNSEEHELSQLRVMQCLTANSEPSFYFTLPYLTLPLRPDQNGRASSCSRCPLYTQGRISRWIFSKRVP